MPSFQHILITRFNLRSATRTWTKMGEEERSNWMQHRWQLFINYCLPSILNQSVKTFNWFIYFDTNTAKEFKDKIEALSAQHPFIHPIYVDSYEVFSKQLTTDILKNKTAESSHFITSRIDNDDCLHRNSIASIQAEFSHQKLQFINLAKGACLAIETDIEASVYTYYGGPFISMIQEYSVGEPLRNIFEKDHHHYFNQYPVKQLESSVYWIQLIHKYNISNGLRGRPERLDLKKDDYGFKLNTKASFKYLIRVLAYYSIHQPIRLTKTLFKKILGKPISIK